jgi:hypothetical protein
MAHIFYGRIFKTQNGYLAQHSTLEVYGRTPDHCFRQLEKLMQRYLSRPQLKASFTLINDEEFTVETK